LSFPIEEYDLRNQFVIDILNNFYNEQDNSFIPVSMRSTFCQRQSQVGCVIVEDSLPFYLDDDHLSDKGASLVINEIFNIIDE